MLDSILQKVGSQVTGEIKMCKKKLMAPRDSEKKGTIAKDKQACSVIRGKAGGR